MLTHVENRITYSGNGSATEFAYQFKILDRTDIKVLLTDEDGKEKLLTKDYYVDVEKNVVRYPGYAVGAEVPESERPAVLPTGWKLTIYREVPVTQETDLPDQYPFNQVEAIGDKLTMIAQQLTDVTSRSLKISVSKSADIDTTIPWENGKSFRISDDGKTLELSEDPAKVLPLVQGVYAQTQTQAQNAIASAAAAAKSENSAAASASEAGNSAQAASASAASAAESAELTSGYKQEALAAKADAAASATNAKTSENNAEASKEAAQSAASNANNFATSASSSASEAKSYRDAANNYAANAKNYSENVNVFLPSVSSAGVLSWTNKAGLTNPASVNIKGAKGDTGTAASIKIGSVTTGAAGSSASVTNSGTASNVVLNFMLPRGKDGKDGGITVDAELNDTSTNPIQNKAVNAGINELAKYTKQQLHNINGAMPTKVSMLENDTGYLTMATIPVFASTDSVNTWTARQTFYEAALKDTTISKVRIGQEAYIADYMSGTAINPTRSTMCLTATGAVTLDMSTIVTDMLGQSRKHVTVFTAYITSDADYTLTITNAGTIKYIGSASDVAITSAGLLLNIMMLKDTNGNVTSIVQASKLEGGA